MSCQPFLVSLVWGPTVFGCTTVICVTVLIYKWPWRRSR